MSSPTLSPNAQLARTTLLNTPEYYGLVNLALAEYAYTDGKAPNVYNSDQIVVVDDIQNEIEALPQLPIPPSPATVAGVWSLVWGPAYSPDYSNLIYAATYSDGGTQANPGAPIFVAVSIRGTDIYTDKEGLLNQLYQDMDATTTVAWPTGDLLPLDGPRIASGTWSGLQKIAKLSPIAPAPGASTTIVEFLQSMLEKDSSLPIIVTGHSLGGCQATVMAPYLLDKLTGVSAGQIVLTPFAPPTAGNAKFAGTVLGQFTAMSCWANTVDFFPMAYSDVNAMKGLWQDYNWPTEPVTQGPVMSDTLKGIADLIVALGGPTHNYTQPPLLTLQNSSSQLPSQQTMETFVNNMKSGPVWNSWIAQLMWQHFPPCYWLAICAEYTAQVAPFYGPTVPPLTQNPLIYPPSTETA